MTLATIGGYKEAKECEEICVRKSNIHVLYVLITIILHTYVVSVCIILLCTTPQA